jgi:predicted PurR-regulated permease PerM
VAKVAFPAASCYNFSMTRSLQETRWRLMAIAVAAAALVAVLAFHLTIALVAAMLVYTGGRRLTEWMEHRTHLPHPAIWSITIVIALIAAAGGFIVERAAEATAAGTGHHGLVVQMAAALEKLRTMLPDWIADNVPVSLDELREATIAWLREHAGQVQIWGQNTLRGATYAIFGVIIGALAVVQTRPERTDNPAATAWVVALAERFVLFEQSFGAVVFAQLRIATVNTALTGFYLLVVLPALGAPLPLAVTLVALTFVASLIPVLGNLVSNTVIVTVSLTQGLGIATLSLAFLIGIHKLEYLLNAHIVGGSIGTKAFELLAMMLLFEAIFGLAGLVMAPIIYAYAKAELRAAGWL